MAEFTYGFLGAGRMATALARGFVSSGQVPTGRILGSDPHPQALEEFARTSGGRPVPDNKTLLESAQVIILAVKPQQVSEVLTPLAGTWTKNHLVVSIAAGITLETLETLVGGVPRVVRVMPNTPCLVGRGASAFCLGSAATAEDALLVERLLSAVGLAEQVPEKLMDAVTGLSGSGPAFVYLMIEALADGGVRMGLPRATAQRLAAQTVEGAAALVLSSGEHPGVLKDQVASPGGTTIAGLQTLEDRAVRGALIAAVQQATERSTQLKAAFHVDVPRR